MVKALISPKPYQRLGTLNPNSGVRVRLPPPVPKTSLPVFSLPRTVSTILPGGSTLLHSTLPEWTGKLDSQSLVTGKPGGDKLSALRVSRTAHCTTRLRINLNYMLRRPFYLLTLHPYRNLTLSICSWITLGVRYSSYILAV